MIWNFTPDLTWSHLIQYDSVSDSIGFNSRLAAASGLEPELRSPTGRGR